jgi:2,4-dienoyl-CoA reductase-like NADH-dependent reductase (Old Yellow Enzyme family)
MSVQPLFTPVRMGNLELPNRIVMAPLTRMRAGPFDHVPTALQTTCRPPCRPNIMPSAPRPD